MRHALKKRDVIGIFSPSYPLTALAPEATRAAIRYLENQGYRIKPGRLCGKPGFLPVGDGSTRDGRKSRSLRPEPRAGGLLPADPPVGRAVWVKLAPAAEVVGTPRQQFVCPPGPGIEMRRIRNRFGIEGGEHPFPSTAARKSVAGWS